MIVGRESQLTHWIESGSQTYLDEVVKIRKGKVREVEDTEHVCWHNHLSFFQQFIDDGDASTKEEIHELPYYFKVDVSNS